MLISSVHMASSPRFLSQRDDDTSGNGCTYTRSVSISVSRYLSSGKNRIRAEVW